MVEKIELPLDTLLTILLICSLISVNVPSTLSKASPTALEAVPNKNCISRALSDKPLITDASEESVVSLVKDS
jgi:hypothetical protein